jgi:hypothetical protein
MKSKQTVNELIIRETPGCLWILSGLFVFVGGVFIYGSLGGFTNWNSVPWWTILLTLLMGSIGFAVGCRMLFHSPITKVIVNRPNELVTLTRYGLFGKTEIVYSFEQIKQFCLVEEKDDKDNLIWSLGIELTDGKIETVSSLPSHFQEQKQKFVFQTNEFMYKQMPSAQNVFEIADESGTKMS